MPVTASKSTPKRQDPTPRPNDIGHVGWTKILNAAPDRRYVWVSTEGYALDEYLGMGYEVERYSGPDGVRPLNTLRLQHGQDIVARANVLMSIPKDAYDAIVRTGPDGITGLDLADKRDAAMKVTKSSRDPMRGLPAGGPIFVNPDFSQGETLTYTDAGG